LHKSPEGTFDKRVAHIIEITNRAEERERKRLVELAKDLILIRIDQSYQDWRKQSASKWSGLIFEGKLKPKMALISPEEYRNELVEKYQEILPDIQRMPTDQLFQMIARLKNSKLLLIEILKSIPKIPFSKRYVSGDPNQISES
jgi:hypothetical protein